MWADLIPMDHIFIPFPLSSSSSSSKDVRLPIQLQRAMAAEAEAAREARAKVRRLFDGNVTLAKNGYFIRVFFISGNRC